MVQLASKKSGPGGQRVRCPKANRELIRSLRWATWGAAPLSDAVRPGGKLVALPTSTLIRHNVPPRTVPSLLDARASTTQAPRRCARVRKVSEINNCAVPRAGFAPLTKLLASSGDGGGMTRRAGARPLAWARDSANDIGARPTSWCTRDHSLVREAAGNSCTSPPEAGERQESWRWVYRACPMVRQHHGCPETHRGGL